MQVLLDTHVLIWWLEDDSRLSSRARQVMQSAERRFVSLASIWEAAIKVSLGKLKSPIHRYPEAFLTAGLEQLPIEFRHLERIADLPFHHNDPFDRLLIVQATVERLPILSADTAFDDYSVKRIW